MDYLTDLKRMPGLFDEDGFLLDGTGWNEEMANRIAQYDGLGRLDACQMEIVRQLRESYERIGAPPSLSHICRLSGMDGDCMHTHFPNAREAWRIAGLPNPGEEAKAYL